MLHANGVIFLEQLRAEIFVIRTSPFQEDKQGKCNSWSSQKLCSGTQQVPTGFGGKLDASEMCYELTY